MKTDSILQKTMLTNDVKIHMRFDSKTSWHGKINLMHCGTGYGACSSERFGLKGSAVCDAIQNTRNCASNDTVLQHRRHYCPATPLRKTYNITRWPRFKSPGSACIRSPWKTFHICTTHFSKIHTNAHQSTNSYQGGFFFEVFWKSL